MNTSLILSKLIFTLNRLREPSSHVAIGQFLVLVNYKGSVSWTDIDVIISFVTMLLGVWVPEGKAEYTPPKLVKK